MKLKNRFLALWPRLWPQLWKDESGQSTVEYILILALVLVVVSKFKASFQEKLLNAVGTIGNQIDDATKQTN